MTATKHKTFSAGLDEEIESWGLAVLKSPASDDNRRMSSIRGVIAKSILAGLHHEYR